MFFLQNEYYRNELEDTVNKSPLFSHLCQTFSRSNISKSASCVASQCLFAFYGGETSYHRYLFLLQLSNLLLFLWLINFSLALEQCTLAGTFASYYWARRKPQDIPPCPLFSSFSRALRSGHSQETKADNQHLSN